MKKLFILFSFIFCMSGWGQDEDLESSFMSINTNTSYGKKIIKSKEISLVYMNNYKTFLRKNNYNEFASTVSRMMDALSNSIPMVSITSENINEYFRCRNNGGAFVNLNDSLKIFLCNITKTDPPLHIIQLMIHESYHLYEAAFGIKVSIDESEYTASDYEVSILQSNGDTCVPFKTSYHEKFQLNPKYCNN